MITTGIDVEIGIAHLPVDDSKFQTYKTHELGVETESVVRVEFHTDKAGVKQNLHLAERDRQQHAPSLEKLLLLSLQPEQL